MSRMDRHKEQLTNLPTPAIDVSDSSCGSYIHIAAQASRLPTWLSATVEEVSKERSPLRILEKALPMENLPQTILDAIVTTRKLRSISLGRFPLHHSGHG
jgi:hypothetical protein